MIIAFWITAAILAAVYLMAGATKLFTPKAKLQAGPMAWAEDFTVPQIKIIAIVEMLAAVGLILPPLTGILPWLAIVAALGLVIVQIVATIVHLRRGEKAIVPNIVLGIFALVVAVLGLLAL